MEVQEGKHVILQVPINFAILLLFSIKNRSSAFPYLHALARLLANQEVSCSRFALRPLGAPISISHHPHEPCARKSKKKNTLSKHINFVLANLQMVFLLPELCHFHRSFLMQPFTMCIKINLAHRMEHFLNPLHSSHVSIW